MTCVTAAHALQLQPGWGPCNRIYDFNTISMPKFEMPLDLNFATRPDREGRVQCIYSDAQGSCILTGNDETSVLENYLL